MSAEKKKSPLGLRILLFAVLALALGALFVDRRARSTAQEANDKLADLDRSGNDVDWASVNGLLAREPSSSADAAGGVIEHYDYAGGLPGRKYTVRVGYAKQLDGTLTYVSHNLNNPEGDAELTQMIAAQGQRVSLLSNEDESFGDSDAGGGRPEEGGPGGGGRGGFGGGRGGGFGGGNLMDNDADGDGKISKEEAPEWMQNFFDNLDGNSDGFVDEEEIAEMRRRRAGGGGGGGRGGPGGRGGGFGGPDNRPERPVRPEIEE